ncbi:MAG: hypothetical protein AB7I30_07240 [Isosphaeraceae bacterium]
MIEVQHVPLLAEQKRIYAIPRGPGRFQDYIATITRGPEVCVAPLVAMNPMAREHVARAVDELLAIDAEEVAKAAVDEANARLSGVPLDHRLKLGLVVLDDLRGGWTDRRYIEMGYRLKTADGRPNATDAILKYGWLSGGLWVTEPMTPDAVRRSVLGSIYQFAHHLRMNLPLTLREMFQLEGRTAVFSGALGPRLDPDDLAYSREVIASWLDSDDVPRQFACLFGDAAARSVGYEPLGLTARAGLAVAIDEARRSGESPEAALEAPGKAQPFPASVPQAAWMSAPPE